ncbi:hypothetical protein GLYMA_07G182500v4 [Glycine max]|uniref:Uncharacterized protein n=1 Tax=Glycine max TaxID=3847 RepID=A0A0R0JFI8_SOYBN|nr:hypothetical protein GYH30_018818 [Glycine max]KRH49839.1 hypothetical protein GLYMA_07G182500v4 [Glycine max]
MCSFNCASYSLFLFCKYHQSFSSCDIWYYFKIYKSTLIPVYYAKVSVIPMCMNVVLFLPVDFLIFGLSVQIGVKEN